LLIVINKTNCLLHVLINKWILTIINKEKKLHDVSCYLAYLFNHVPILFLKKRKIQFEAKN